MSFPKFSLLIFFCQRVSDMNMHCIQSHIKPRFFKKESYRPVLVGWLLNGMRFTVSYNLVAEVPRSDSFASCLVYEVRAKSHRTGAV